MDDIEDIALQKIRPSYDTSESEHKHLSNTQSETIAYGQICQRQSMDGRP